MELLGMYDNVVLAWRRFCWQTQTLVIIRVGPPFLADDAWLGIWLRSFPIWLSLPVAAVP